jgi:hypothetical protein
MDQNAGAKIQVKLLGKLAEAEQQCRRWPLYRNATQPVRCVMSDRRTRTGHGIHECFRDVRTIDITQRSRLPFALTCGRWAGRFIRHGQTPSIKQPDKSLVLAEA